MTKTVKDTNKLIVAPDFSKNKNKLKAFSEKLPKKAELPIVEEDGGLFGLFDHDVTGSELNDLTDEIQNIMIAQNKAIVKTIKEFNTVYDTFSALDKEYIQEILISLKVAEKANDEVKNSQEDITHVIEQQKQLIQALKNFKGKIDKVKHFTDIDDIFVSYATLTKELKTTRMIAFVSLGITCILIILIISGGLR
jgi:ABC-type transporter Mla subunit MlaD